MNFWLNQSHLFFNEPNICESEERLEISIDYPLPYRGANRNTVDIICGDIHGSPLYLNALNRFEYEEIFTFFILFLTPIYI